MFAKANFDQSVAINIQYPYGIKAGHGMLEAGKEAIQFTDFLKVIGVQVVFCGRLKYRKKVFYGRRGGQWEDNFINIVLSEFEFWNNIFDTVYTETNLVPMPKSNFLVDLKYNF